MVLVITIFASVYLLIGLGASYLIVKYLESVIDRYESESDISEREEKILEELIIINKLYKNGELTIYLYVTFLWLPYLVSSFFENRKQQ